MISPKVDIQSFTYDILGDLVAAQDPAGGSKTLTRTDTSEGREVSVETAMGPTTAYQLERLSTGQMHLVNTFSCGCQTKATIGTDGTTTTTSAEGRVTTLVKGPDPRFGMESPLPKSLTITTPGSLNSTTTTERSVTQAEPDNPLNLTEVEDQVTINRRTYGNIFDRATCTFTSTSPEGRQIVTALDEQGRPLEIQTTGLDSATFSYGARGRLEQTAHGTRQTSFAYDNSTGLLESITNALGETARFGRDAAGRAIGLSLPDGATWGYSSDKDSNLETLTEPDGTTTHQFAYTRINLLETYRSPLGAQETFIYKKDKWPTRRELPSGRAIEWIYNTNGELTTVRTQEGHDTFTYDPDSGLVTRSVSRDAHQVAQ